MAAPVLTAAGRISSSHEKSQVLHELNAKGAVTEATAASFFGAVNSITSSYDRARVLSALVTRSSSSLNDDPLLIGVLDASKGVTSSHERASLLLTIINTRTVTGVARTRLIDIAEGMSSASARNQVLAALVRAERR